MKSNFSQVFSNGKKTEAIQTATAQIQRIDEISEQCKKELEKIDLK
jgi:hypothetical protein